MLDELQKTISMAELAKDAEQIANDIETAGTVYRVKRPGHRTMLDDAYFAGWKVAIELMQRPNWRAEWARSERAGAGTWTRTGGRSRGADR